VNCARVPPVIDKKQGNLRSEEEKQQEKVSIAQGVMTRQYAMTMYFYDYHLCANEISISARMLEPNWK
jgi:hypothetical protein